MNRGKASLVIWSIFAAIIVAAYAPTSAQIVTADIFSGRATGIRSVTTTNGAATTVVTGDTCPLPDRGGTSTVTTSGIIIPARLATGTITSTTSGSGITSQSSSTVNNFFFSGGGWTVRADTIGARTQCNCCDILNPGCSGEVVISGLTVTDPSGANFPITFDGSVGQTVTLPNGAGTIRFNERTAATGELTVNAMHINIVSGTTTFDVIVASAHSDITCPGTVITAEEVNVSGRVVDPSGAGIAAATVTITNSQGTVVRSTFSGNNGDYTLTGIESGSTYVVSASRKGYAFTPRSLNVLSEVTGFNITGTPR